MKRSLLNPFLAALLGLSSVAHAAPLTWDGGPSASTTDDLITPGAGTWTTGGTKWDDGIVNSLNGTWANGDDATFGGTAGTVTVSGGVNAHNITFQTGYTVAASTLTLSGTTPTITTDTGVSASIGSVIAGTAGLTKTGAGTLTLTSVNSYTGGTIVNGGTLKLNAGGFGVGNLRGSATGLLGICFWREVPETAVGADRRAGKRGLFLQLSPVRVMIQQRHRMNACVSSIVVIERLELGTRGLASVSVRCVPADVHDLENNGKPWIEFFESLDHGIKVLHAAFEGQLEFLTGIVIGELEENEIRLMIDHPAIKVLQTPIGVLAGTGRIDDIDEPGVCHIEPRLDGFRPFPTRG
jgi:autotransporter-associated beta strand protein